MTSIDENAVCTYTLASEVQSKRLIKLGTTDRITVPVITIHDAGQSLESYFRLPVSQYVLIEVPMGGSLKRVSTDVFEVVVAPVRFFDIWVQPRVRCIVRLLDMPLRVDIRCVECILDGSPAVSELRLQERVQFDVHTCFRCQQDPPAILSESEIDVTVEPPGPFVFVPDIVLQAVGNAGLYQALSTLQRVFIRSLAKDYARWATNAEYRKERVRYAAQSDELIAQEQAERVLMQSLSR
ncbi:g10256 [Coccomyxa elongata]